MVPRKQSRISQGLFTFWMGCGILLGTSLIGIINLGRVPSTSWPLYVLMVSSGIVWATGTLAYCIAVKYIGLSRSTPVKNLSAIFGTLIGIVIFHEFSISRFLPCALAIMGSLAVVVSTTLLSRVESFDDAVDVDKKPKYIWGILSALWAAIAYSAYTVPMKMAYAQHITPSAFLYFMGQGCFIGMTLLAVALRTWKRKEPITWHERRMAALSGLMWAAGSFCANTAIKSIGIAVAWPLTKNTVIAVLYGVFVLKEIDTIKHKNELRIGLALSIAGIILLAVAMK